MYDPEFQIKLLCFRGQRQLWGEKQEEMFIAQNNGASGPFITHHLRYKTAPALQNFRL